jgi:hypothetical protein
VGSLENRLARLEANAVGKAAKGTPRYLQRYFKDLANVRRAEAGLEPLPYTEEDREDDRRCLLEVIPAYRASRGWQTEKARSFLDRWEQHVREKLAATQETATTEGSSDGPQ